MMVKKLVGKKLNMSQIFDKGGNVLPVTLIKVIDSKADLANLVNTPVTITGVSKGKGFTGVMKKWGFSGGPATHGQSDRQRAPGSIGATTTPGRVLPGKKMPGRAGGKKITIKGLKVVWVDDEEKIIKINGAVPGARNEEVVIKFVEKSENEKQESSS